MAYYGEACIFSATRDDALRDLMKEPDLDLFAALAWCGHGLASFRPPLGGALGPILALFLAGLAGSPAHCAAMCGPFVLGQVSDRLARVPLARLGATTRLTSGMLLPYHLGRLVTYGGLGAAMGWLGSGLVRVPWLSWMAAALLLGAALVFLAAALRSVLPALNRLLPRAGTAFALPIARLTRGLDTTTRRGGLMLGLALGFLPCGFLYTGLVVAAGTASPLTGALAMVAFGAGTMPSLIVVGIAGHFAGHRLNAVATRFAPAVMILNAAMLTGIGLQRLAPLIH